LQIEKRPPPKKIQYYVHPNGTVGRVDDKNADIPLSSIMIKNYDMQGMSVDDILDSIGTPTDRIKKQQDHKKRARDAFKQIKPLQPKVRRPEGVLPMWLNQNSKFICIDDESTNIDVTFNQLPDASKEFSIPMTPAS
jgi:hypothetical protein